MLSSQINFFHLDSDLPDFMEFFETVGLEVKYYKTASLSETDFSYRNGDAIPYRICLVPNGYKKQVKYDFIESQGYYLLKVDHSTVIDFSLTNFIRPNELSPGRFYFTPKYFDAKGECFVQKDVRFAVEAKRIYGKFKRRFLVRNDLYKGWWITNAVNEKLNCGEFDWNVNSIIVR